MCGDVERGAGGQKALTGQAADFFWDAKNESGAGLLATLCGDGSTVPFHDFFADGQAHSRAIPLAPPVQALEGFEDTVRLLLIKPDALIVDPDFPKTIFAVMAGDGYPRWCIFFVELNGIEDQVSEQLSHLNFIHRQSG